jgi:hypothetical protein
MFPAQSETSDKASPLGTATYALVSPHHNQQKVTFIRKALHSFQLYIPSKILQNFFYTLIKS